MDPTTLGFEYCNELQQWTKYHGMGYYQVLIIRGDNQYQVKLAGGSSVIERSVNEIELERLINDPLIDVVLNYDQLRDVINATDDSHLATLSCEQVLKIIKPPQ